MRKSDIITQLKAELAQENQEITTIMEMQEQHLEYLTKLAKEHPEQERLINGIIYEFSKTMI